MLLPMPLHKIEYLNLLQGKRKQKAAAAVMYVDHGLMGAFKASRLLAQVRRKRALGERHRVIHAHPVYANVRQILVISRAKPAWTPS